MRVSAWNFITVTCMLAGAVATAQQSNETPASQRPTSERSSNSESGRSFEGSDGKRFDNFRRPPFPSHTRIGRSSAEYLRELMAMTPAQLEQELAPKSEHWRKFWNAKVEEYKGLSTYDREVRLRTTQMTYYLDKLLYMKPELRQEQLATLPEDFRPLVEERLKHWEQLPRETRKAVLDNKRTMEYFSRLEAAPPEQKDSVFQLYSPEGRQSIEKRLDDWRGRPKEERAQMYDHFTHFFQLSEREKERILETVSELDRKQASILEQFEKLPPDERKACIDSFRKFVNMTPEQRTQFFRNAEKWQKMRPDEKDAWRSTVQQMPPLPPGLSPWPPMPPRVSPKVTPFASPKTQKTKP